MLGVTADLAFAAGSLIAGLIAHNPGLDADVVVFHDGLDAPSMAALRRLCPRVRFRLYGREEALARLGIAGDTPPQLADFLRRFSPMTVAKLELPELLADYDRCVWLDADMLVRGDVGGLWGFGPLAWRPLPEGAFARRDRVLAALSHLRRDPAVPLLNGGVIGVARGFAATSADLFAMARLLLERTDTNSPVEMAWYFVAATKRIPVTPLPLALNHPVSAPGVGDARLLHAIGPHKFWNASPLRHLFPEWQRHQDLWVAAGGAPYAGPVTLTDVHPLEPDALMRAVQHRADWLSFHDGLRPLLPAGLQVDPRLDRKALRLFLAGRPEADHLTLTRLPHPRRIALRLNLPPLEEATVRAALVSEVKGLRERDGALNLPLDRLQAALGVVMRILG